MKKYFGLLIILIFLAGCSRERFNDGMLSYEPAKPEKGDAVDIYYNPSGSKLQDKANISAIVYAYYSDEFSAADIELKKEDSLWKGSFKPTSDAEGLLIKFYEGETIDNNEGKGYFIYLHDGDIPVQGALSGHATSLNSWGRSLSDLEKDTATVSTLYREELSKYPGSKAMLPYLSFIERNDKERLPAMAAAEAERVNGLTDKSYEDYMLLYLYGEKYIAGFKPETALNKLIEIKPSGRMALSEDIKLLSAEQDIDKKIELAKKALEKYSDSFNKNNLLSRLVSLTIRSGDPVQFEKVYNAFANKINPMSLNQAAWDFAEKGVAIDKAANYAQTGVNLFEDILKNKNDMFRQQYQSPKEYFENLDYSYGMILDTYAYILDLKGDYKSSADNYAKAVEKTKGDSPEINEKLIVSLEKTGEKEKLIKEAESFIATGKKTSKIEELFSKYYLELNPGADLIEKIKTLNAKAYAKIISGLKEKEMNEPAPLFTLNNLAGKTISLNDLKGKIVIIDFWATWCGPCRSSFPGMQQALDKFGGDDVEFLFINTWENVPDKKDNADKFIKENKYSFNVLLDLDNKVIESYKVQGIPTKFIVGKDGSIKFKSVGFGGSSEELVNELGAMISMLK